ncbi:MAG: beta-lactamase family protein [Xanthomonadaceae bacterium]|jgi:CubicO group peptidase (beta-lactamase class C family)|nr:beta-lactamase family protein [Xanthomonadaceae bacterium]
MRVKPFTSILLGAALLAPWSCVAATPQRGTPDFSEVEALMALTVAAVPLSGATLLLATDEAEVLALHYGTHTPNTRLSIASASKWLSAATVASLVDSGELGWDTTLGSVMPDAPVDKRSITLRQLFSHTSGIPARDLGCLRDQSVSLAQCAAQILAAPLIAAPGTCFSYGGNAMQVAGRMAELASGMSWDALFRTRIAQPLGLMDTDYAVGRTDPGYVDVPNPHIGGGARSSARDMIRIARLYLQDGRHAGVQVLQPATVAFMRADQTQGVPYINNPDPRSYGHGIGTWRNRVDGQGAAFEVSSAGAGGTWPWLDTSARVAGVFFVDSTLASVQPYVRRLTAVVRTAVGGGAPLFGDGVEGTPMRQGCG